MVREVTIELSEPSDRGTHPEPIGRLLATVPQLAAYCVRMRMEGRSRAPGAPPQWLRAASDVRLNGYSNGGARAVLRFDVPRLGEAAPGLYGQRDLWSTRPDPDDTPFDLIADAVAAVATGDDDSELLDTALLGQIRRLTGVFDRGCTAVAFTGARHQAADASSITSETARRATEMTERTPSEQACRVVGVLDMIRASTQRFDIRLDGGDTLAGVYVADQNLVGLRDLLEHRVVVAGRAVFRSSGRVLRVDAEVLEAAGAGETALWSRAPKARAAKLDLRSLRVPQDARSGVAAIMGKWPGDETDEEIRQALRELS